jgi:hypothetical protein
MFIRVYRLGMHYVMYDVGMFDPALWPIVPLTFSLVHFSPSESQSTYTDSVWLGVGAGGMLSPVGDHILQELTLCIWLDSEPAKLLDHPKQIPRRGP